MPATSPVSVTPSQVPPAARSRPPNAWGAVSRRSVGGVAGRARYSSRLAATTSGQEGKAPTKAARVHTVAIVARSEERRVGKECRSRRRAAYEKKKEKEWNSATAARQRSRC